MERIVDVSQDGQHLSIHRGFLLVERDGTEVGRVALDDIAALLVHAHGITYSNSVLVELATRNAGSGLRQKSFSGCLVVAH